MTTTVTRRFCSGDRGNVCSGRIVENSLSKCSSEESDGNLVADQCKGKTPWSQISPGVSCYGSNGCKYCNKAIVDIDRNLISSSLDVCGCGAIGYNTGGEYCDNDGDGNFEGWCIGNSCQPRTS